VQLSARTTARVGEGHFPRTTGDLVDRGVFDLRADNSTMVEWSGTTPCLAEEKMSETGVCRVAPAGAARSTKAPESGAYTTSAPNAESLKSDRRPGELQVWSQAAEVGGIAGTAVFLASLPGAGRPHRHFGMHHAALVQLLRWPATGCMSPTSGLGQHRSALRRADRDGTASERRAIQSRSALQQNITTNMAKVTPMATIPVGG